MTKSNDTSLIEDTEIPPEDLVEELLDEEEITDIDEGESDLEEGEEDTDHATIIEAHDDDDASRRIAAR